MWLLCRHTDVVALSSRPKLIAYIVSEVIILKCTSRAAIDNSETCSMTIRLLWRQKHPEDKLHPHSDLWRGGGDSVSREDTTQQHLQQEEDWINVRKSEAVNYVMGFSAPVQTCSGVHPASCAVGTDSPGVKRPGCGVNHHPHLAPRLKKEWRYTSAPFVGLLGLLHGELCFMNDAVNALQAE